MTGDQELGRSVAVVTGGSGAIGKAIGLALALEGAQVALVARRAEPLERAASAIADDGADVVTFAADVCDTEQLTEVRNDLIRRFGQIDILVNVAGGNVSEAIVPDDGSPFDLDLDGVRALIELNLLGTMRCVNVFGPALAASAGEDRAIVNVSSMAAARALTRVGAYGAAKAGIEAYTRWLAVECARRSLGIRANAIAPGFVLGEQNRALLYTPDGLPTARTETILWHTPMGRLGAPDEMAAAVVWLCGPGSRFVNGAIVPVDGGFGAFSGV